jgi:hypothetical protein
MASRVALDLRYWAMHLALYNLICMAIEMARKAGPIMGNTLGIVPPDPHGHRNGLQSRFIFFFCRFYVLHNCSYTTMLWFIKIKAKLYYCSLLCY